MIHSLKQSLGIDPVITKISGKKKEILLNCWASTHTLGTYKGVRDASPGLLKIQPTDQDIDMKNITIEDVRQHLHNSSRTVIFPFSILSNTRPRIAWTIPGDMGIVLESLKPVTWLDRVNDVALDTFRNFDFEKALQAVYEDAPVSIIVNSNASLVSSIQKVTKDISKHFECTNILYYKINKVSERDIIKYGKANFRCTLLKPSQCIPFFGKDDGGIMHITITQSNFSKANGQFTPLLELVFLFTNNIKAVHNVDGGYKFYENNLPFSKTKDILNNGVSAFKALGKDSVCFR